LFRRTAADYVELINWALQQLPKKRGTAEQVFQKLKEQGFLKITNIRAVIFYKNLISDALGNYFLERSHTERGDVIYEADPEDEEESYMEDGRNEEDSVLPDRMDTDKSANCTKHRYSVIKCSVDCPFRPHNVVLQKQKEKEAVERDREKRARAERKARREQSKPDDWINDTPLDDDKKLRKTKPKQPANQEEQTRHFNTNNNNSSGRRWIRFACEKHRREHSRCPDNCPMRKKSFYEPEGEGSLEDNSALTDLHNGITSQLGLPYLVGAFANATP